MSQGMFQEGKSSCKLSLFWGYPEGRWRVVVSFGGFQWQLICVHARAVEQIMIRGDLSSYCFTHELAKIGLNHFLHVKELYVGRTVGGTLSGANLY